jgi:GMP synthase (glutamine-hydrolysing)
MSMSPSFKPSEFVARAVEDVRRIVGGEMAIAACSGGVDSTVSAYIAKMALGDRLKTIYIDDGFRREGEVEETIKILGNLGLNPILLDKKSLFYRNLRGVIDAERKRKIFRETFYNVIRDFMKSNGIRFLVQGTIAADIVETKGGIKTQHNVLEQIGVDYGFKVVEPLKELYKPQVREVARYLGLPKEISEKMPFPGPGLMIRVVGEVNPKRVEIVRKATKIVEEELRDVDAFQKFAVLLPGRATGIRDGRRKYGYMIAIRVVASEDAITASPLEIPFSKLKRITDRITSEINDVVRVLYELTPKPPSTIEFE